MKQIFQNFSNGKVLIEELPRPQCKAGHLLIKTKKTLISTGTERMLVDFGKANYFDKARQQPEKVKEVFDKIKSDGIFSTVEAVKSKLEKPIPMGYSNVGIVEDVGAGVSEFNVGDRVISNGAHSELVCVPKNLVAKIPNSVSDDDAVYTVVSSISLQGIRLLQPTIGENIVVMGLGLIGLIAIQILKANGCNVLGIDHDTSKIEIANKLGIKTLLLSDKEDSVELAKKFSNNIGVDGVLISASTKSNDPIHNAAKMCRQKGRIVLVGVVGLDLQRKDFYEKELSFSVSCSYGPGRYDNEYEEKGNDYPIGYVRWTEKRNFIAILDLINQDLIKYDLLRTAEFSFEEAASAYEKIIKDSSSLGIVLNYDQSNAVDNDTIEINKNSPKFNKYKSVVLGSIGAGNYAGRVLLPAFKKSDVFLKTIASSQGASSGHIAKKLGFYQNTTDHKKILDDPEINTVVVATQHDSHAKFVIDALKASKNVFVEKPLALSLEELDDVKQVYLKEIKKDNAPLLMVGFNRRFSALSQKAKSYLSCEVPMSISYTCNAGFIPENSWVHDIKKGGGRIIGESCHFIDLCRFFTGSKLISIDAVGLKEKNSPNDNAILSLEFENGSIASINYFSNGSKKFPKERIDIFQSGKNITINNFFELKSYGFGKLSNKRIFKQDKGQKNCVKTFTNSIINGSPSPINFEEIFEVSKFSILASETLLKK